MNMLKTNSMRRSLTLAAVLVLPGAAMAQNPNAPAAPASAAPSAQSAPAQAAPQSAAPAPVVVSIAKLEKVVAQHPRLTLLESRLAEDRARIVDGVNGQTLSAAQAKKLAAKLDKIEKTVSKTMDKDGDIPEKRYKSINASLDKLGESIRAKKRGV